MSKIFFAEHFITDKPGSVRLIHISSSWVLLSSYSIYDTNFSAFHVCRTNSEKSLQISLTRTWRLINVRYHLKIRLLHLKEQVWIWHYLRLYTILHAVLQTPEFKVNHPLLNVTDETGMFQCCLWKSPGHTTKSDFQGKVNTTLRLFNIHPLTERFIPTPLSLS